MPTAMVRVLRALYEKHVGKIGEGQLSAVEEVATKVPAEVERRQGLHSGGAKTKTKRRTG